MWKREATVHFSDDLSSDCLISRLGVQLGGPFVDGSRNKNSTIPKTESL